MTGTVRNIAILGSTGSIGQSALEVVAAAGQRFRVVGLTAHTNLALLVQQAKSFQPRWLAATDSRRAAEHDWSATPAACRVHTGPDDLCRLVRQDDVDVVVSAIVGSAGLTGTLAAVEAGKTIALANKETLVAAGPLVMRAAAEHHARILPVDSEHSAVFQCLAGGRGDEVKRIVLTASGGPFRQYSLQQLAEVTVAQALAHPTWNMGRKITIDSATMMNKALEIIEARWLFGLPPEQIDVVVHPQSIVHSLVEFRDGSTLAQLSPPDMKLPIQYALTYPDRWPSPAAKLDFSARLTLDFEPPDFERFPALSLGYEVAEAGGTAGVVLNAANEAAVAAFLNGRLRFTEIVAACRKVLGYHQFDASPSLEQLLRLDAWARQEISRWLAA